MKTTILDLGSRLLVVLAGFMRQSKRGVLPSGPQLRDEIVRLFRELDQQAHVEPGLAEVWQQARKPLVYLLDEVLIRTEWEYRAWWRDNCLEREVLGHSQAMRGIMFFDELDHTVREFERAGGAASPASDHHLDLLTIYYCALRFGFNGKFSGQPSELEREADNLRAKLPAEARQRGREFFPQAYQNTVEVPPSYQTYMRLATLLGLAAVMALLLVGFRQYLGHDLLHELQDAAQRAGAHFASQG